MNHRLLSAVLLLATLSFAGCVSFDTTPTEDARIVEVVDGDTLVTADDETVRLLGINAPEDGERYSDAARERLSDMVLNKTVQLEAGRTEQDHDQYGRSLRYVHVDDILVNRVMVAEGLATTYLLDDDDPYQRPLLRAEEAAREQGTGVWAPSSVSACITVTAFNWNPSGNDNYRLNEEYTTFQNTCQQPLDVTGWTVKDSGTNRYTFSTHTLSSGETVTLHTGRGTDNATDLYWDRRQAVWNNDGDALYVLDREELLVAHQQYAGR